MKPTLILFQKVSFRVLTYLFLILLVYLCARTELLGIYTILFSSLIILFFPIFSIAMLTLDIMKVYKGDLQYLILAAVHIFALIIFAIFHNQLEDLLYKLVGSAQ